MVSILIGVLLLGGCSQERNNRKEITEFVRTFVE